MGAIGEQAALLRREWETDARWAGVRRDYSAQDVIRLRGRVAGEHGLARRGASRLWELLHRQNAVPALGPVAGRHAALAAGAGLQAGYPVVADAEAGLGGALDAFELMTALIEAGAAGVLFEDRLSPGKARGQLDGKVLVPTGQHIETLTSARLAADVLGVPSLVIARSGAREASLLASDIDERDQEFLTGEMTADGFHRVEPGLYACVTRVLAFAPYADLLWLETPAPDLAAARAFATIIRSQFPGKPLAYSCPSLSAGRAHPGDASVAQFQRELAAMGYRFQSTTPAGHPAPVQPASELGGRRACNGAPAYA